MSRHETVKRHRDGAGFSIPAAAEAIGVSPKTLRTAIVQQQVHVIAFGGLVRVPKMEVERLRQLFGKEDSVVA